VGSNPTLSATFSTTYQRKSCPHTPGFLTGWRAGGALKIFQPARLASGFAQALGDCSEVSAFGGRAQIRLRESVLTGRHRLVREGTEYAEGRFLYVGDILLHEMVHQWQQGVTGKKEISYKGHGPTFRDKCNEIGRELGLPAVRVAKARGKERELPSCAEWPHCVRPSDYYLGAAVETEDDVGHEESNSGLLKVLAVRAKEYWQACQEENSVEEAREKLCAAALKYAGGAVD
jgi:hypothetical protein